MKFGAIAIGRNEGVRLKRCLESLSQAAALVYVDSGSRDESVQLARGCGADVVELDRSLPFTAARARNAGFRRLRETAPELEYVQFIDADCELVEDWSKPALLFFVSHEDVAAVCGRLRERHPERSIYNWLCDCEWQGSAGEIVRFGGIVMMRTIALVSTGGFRGDLIAGEEPELSIRLRAEGWRIWRLDCEMAVHDAAMMRFG